MTKISLWSRLHNVKLLHPKGFGKKYCKRRSFSAVYPFDPQAGKSSSSDNFIAMICYLTILVKGSFRKLPIISSNGPASFSDRLGRQIEETQVDFSFANWCFRPYEN